MTQATGLPAGQRGCAPYFRAAVLAAVVNAVFYCAPAASAESRTQPKDQVLDRMIESIAAAFRSEKADPIASLVPPDGKAFISLRSLGGGAGYYSRDQVYFIFNRVFTQYDTVKFTVREPKGDRPGRETTYCVGLWYYHRHDGVDGNSQIHFVLSQRKGNWSLAEIREAQ